MKKTLLKSIGTLLLAVLTVCLCWGPILGSSTAAVNIINVYENFPQSDKSANTSGTGSYSIYWEYWSQGASKYSVMKSGGSFLVAEAKLLLDSGVVPPGYIDPDKYYEWGKTNNYFKNNISIANTDYLKLLVNYAKQFHVDVTYEIVSLSGKTQKYSAALVQSAINDGYYVVLFNSKKAVYVGYSLSRKYEKPILLDSKADYSYAAEQVQTYVGSEYKGDAEFAKQFHVDVTNPDV